MDAVNVCAEVYVGIVTKLCNKIPSVFELLLAKKRQKEALIEDEPTIGKMSEFVRPMSLPQDNYDLLIQSYESLTPKISIEKFCKEHGINVVEFKEQRKVWLMKG